VTGLPPTRFSTVDGAKEHGWEWVATAHTVPVPHGDQYPVPTDPCGMAYRATLCALQVGGGRRR
jgi:hypothetical protein